MARRRTTTRPHAPLAVASPTSKSHESHEGKDGIKRGLWLVQQWRRRRSCGRPRWRRYFLELGGGSSQAATAAVASAAMWAARWQHLSLSGGGRRTGRTTDHRLAPLLRADATERGDALLLLICIY